LESGRPISVHIAFYFLRRILIPVSIIFNDYFIVQAVIMAYGIIAHVINLKSTYPLEGGAFEYNMEIFHEMTMMQVLYTMFCFTEFVPDPITRGYIGYYSMVMVSVHLGVCLFFMLRGSCKSIVNKIKEFIF